VTAPIIITQGQIINLSQLLAQWSALASVDQINLEARAQASDKSVDHWRAGAAAGRAVAYNRAAQQLQIILGTELPAAEPPSF
jgi:hypothetical protein